MHHIWNGINIYEHFLKSYIDELLHVERVRFRLGLDLYSCAFIFSVKPVLNVAFYMRRMHSKQWIMRHFSTCKMRRLEQA